MVRHYDVAVMHDFFVDRLVKVGEQGKLQSRVTAKRKQGGGGIHGVRQYEIRGGNAVNLANALGRLGLRTLLITHSEKSHLGLLTDSFEGLEVELRVKPLPAGLTVALESNVNVMLGDVGGAGDFGPSNLDESDWDALSSARVVCSVNWAANRKGTGLLRALRRRLGKEKTIFFDPADFRDRVREFGLLLAAIQKEGLVDWMSMNEPEGMASSRLLGIRRAELGRLAMELARRLGVVFDLHAISGSFTSEGTRVTTEPVRKVRARRLTGAGDVWDAGAIYGRLTKMDERARLSFANAAAKLYVENKLPVPPTKKEVLKQVG